jgi:hypothetical protein
MAAARRPVREMTPYRRAICATAAGAADPQGLPLMTQFSTTASALTRVGDSPATVAQPSQPPSSRLHDGDVRADSTSRLLGIQGKTCS